MPTTSEILDAAKKIGDMVAQHDASKRLESAIKALEKDPDAQRAMTQFNQHLQALAQKEQAGKPIEVADKRALETLQQAVVMNVNLRNFQMAQMDYVDLLRKIDEQITGDVPGPGSDPGAVSGAGGGGMLDAASPFDLTGR